MKENKPSIFINGRSLSEIVFFILSISASIAGCEKYDLDRKMNELCSHDGGEVIFEKAIIDKSEIGPAGLVRTSSREENGKKFTVIASNYLLNEDADVLDGGDPLKGEGRLTRVKTQIVRISDGKVMAEGVQYIRAGGDGYYVGHFTQASCPDRPLDLARMVFELRD